MFRIVKSSLKPIENESIINTKPQKEEVESLLASLERKAAETVAYQDDVVFYKDEEGNLKPVAVSSLPAVGNLKPMGVNSLAAVGYEYEKKWVSDCSTMRNDVEEMKKMSAVLFKQKNDLFLLTVKDKQKITNEDELALLHEVINYFENNSSENLEKVKKDADKGMVNKKFVRFINKYYSDVVSPSIYNLYERAKQYSQGCPSKEVNIITGCKDKRIHSFVINGKPIPNRNSLLWLYANDYNSWEDKIKDNQTKGWEWANSNLRTVSTKYPIDITYKTSDSHPNYAIVDNGIYDKNGKLVRVISCFRANDKIFLRALCVQDYNENKYDIKSKPAKTQTYIKTELGMIERAKKTASEKNEWREFFHAESEKQNATSYREYKRANQKSRASAYQIFNNEYKKIDHDGWNFLGQLEEDHKQDVKLAYECERIDNTSFKLKYVNINNNGTSYTVKVEYKQEKPFKMIENVTILKKENEPLNIDSFYNESMYSRYLYDLRSGGTSVRSSIYNNIYNP